MPINREKELLFIHVPKTGGTKIEEALGMKYAGDDPGVSSEKLYGFVRIHNELYELQHLTYKQILDFGIIDKSLFNRCYKFAFVRNPFDRVVSEYFWLGYKYFSKFEGFVEFLYKKKGEPDTSGTVENYMSLDWLLDSAFYTPQHKFICNRRGKLMVDFLGRFEDFSEDLATLLDNLKVEYNEEFLFKKINATKHEKYTSYYDKKTRNMIKSIYKRDFEIFGYE